MCHWVSSDSHIISHCVNIPVNLSTLLLMAICISFWDCYEHSCTDLLVSFWIYPQYWNNWAVG